MEVKWYKFYLEDCSNINEICEVFNEVISHYPKLKGNSLSQKLENYDSVGEKHTFYFSLNSKIGLYSEILQKKYSAIACEKPVNVRHL